MLTDFESFVFSVSGIMHRRDAVEGQDSSMLEKQDEFILLAVSDGVGSEADSRLGSTLLCQALRRLVREHGKELVSLSYDMTSAAFGQRFVAWLNRELSSELLRAASYLGGEELKEVSGRFLVATMLGAFVTPAATVVFVCGDGVFAVNGSLYEVSPTGYNEPTLPIYEALKVPDRVGLLQVAFTQETSQVYSLLVGTDGALEFVGSHATSEDSGRERNLLISMDRERFLESVSRGRLPFDDATMIGLHRRVDMTDSTANPPPTSKVLTGV